MVFNSLVFLFLFLPFTALGFYYFARRGGSRAIAWLIAASLVFYGSWDYRFLPILLTSVLVNFAACRWIMAGAGEKIIFSPRSRLTLAIIFNLGLLCFFKYVNFLIGTVEDISGSGRVLPALDIILPIGISFFTFTQISVLVDAYHGKIKELKFSHYCLFACYFPYIVAGPILRQGELLPQFKELHEGRKFFTPTAENFAIGISIFVFGLGKKLLIADNLAALVTAPVFAGGDPQLFQAWLGMLAYTFQLYFDFSGYSDMAIGVSRILGFTIPINFHSPYKATNVSDFWQRWHISLSQFLRNYLYIPLGGNRHGQFRRYRNLVLTMLLGGLWHGANWTFVVWGGLHGLYLCIQHGWQGLRKAKGKTPSAAMVIFHRILTFLAVMIAWCFFRAPDVSSAMTVLAGMVGCNGISPVTEVGGPAYVMLAASAAIVFFMPNTNELFLGADRDGTASASPALVRPNWSPSLRWGLAIGLVLALCLISIEQTADFIYAQF